MTTLRLPIDRRPIIHDSSFPLGGSRDRRRLARDDGPLEARAALQDHMQRCMQSDDYSKACTLLDYLISALLGPDTGEGEGEPSAMDSRRDPQPGELAKMFPTSINPTLASNAGAGERAFTATDSRVLDHRPGVLSKLFADAPNPRLNYR